MPKLAYRSTLPRPDDPEILDSIAQDVANGVPLRFAATAAGISESTAYHWAMAGRQALEEADNSAPLEELGSHAVFVQTTKEAEARCVQDGVRYWRAGGKNWAKWATLLERRFPQDFGRRDRTEVDITQRTLTITVALDNPTREKLLALLGERLALPSGAGKGEEEHPS